VPERDRIQSLLALPALDAEQIEEIRLLVMKYKGVEYALDRAHIFAQTAKSALHAFPESEDREILALIADFVVDRDW
jgi:geranylgeranyl pyrophosphate synthase